MKDKKFNIDEALKRLEEINTLLAAEDIELEKSLELYKEGTLLASKCQEHLEGVEKELLLVNGDNNQ